jgi:Fe-S-cluster containining protein
MLAFYECDGCAACCGTYAIFASREDAQREPRIVAECQELAAWLETPKWAYRLFPLPFHEACCFLDSQRRCTIYETRPQVCREFAAGSEDCQRVRSLRGLALLEPVQRPVDGPGRVELGEPGH